MKEEKDAKEDRYADPKPILNLRYSDISAEAESCGVDLTREQVRRIFGRIDASRSCAVMSAFWEMIRREIGRETGTDAATEYTDMPEDEPVISVMWRDIVQTAEDLDVKLSREQVIEVFKRLDGSDWEDLCGVYSDAVEYTIHDVLEEAEKKACQN